MKYYLYIGLFFLIATISVNAQTADITKGCTPLEIQFSAPSQAAYYWEFVEGNATSKIKNPKHTFTIPGTYSIKLYNGQGGSIVGEIEIIVFEDPKIDFTANVTVGCSPLVVIFTSQITLDPALTVTGYKWAFGDGGISTDANPSHIYNSTGEFDVSVELTTDYATCIAKTNLVNYISTNTLSVDFSIDSYQSCTAPKSFSFTNNTLDEDGNTYHWDFGNGQSSDNYEPGSITYNDEGEYTVILTVTNTEGCVETKEKTIRIGKPVFDINPPDTACLDQSVIFNNSTDASFFQWDFIPSATANVQEREPNAVFSSPGLYTVNLTAIEANCSSDTSFNIFIEEVNPEFTIDPITSCFDIVNINLEATEKGYNTYSWKTTIPDINIDSLPITSFEYIDPPRDSLYWHKKDSFYIQLMVESKNGCSATSKELFIIYRPNAHFAVSIASGCAPIEVVLSDSSESQDPIIKWTYFYGDGQSQTFDNNDDHTHTYTTPGEYYVKQIIETNQGCIDTSAGLWVKVGEPITPIFEVDKTEICLGEEISVTFMNDDPRIDAFHLDTDNGRFNHCWKSKVASHTFNTLPGTYPVTATIDYNGCMTTVTAPYQIKVNGAKADIGYMINCENTHDIMLNSESTNASSWIWTIDTTVISNKENLVHTIDSTGNYKLKLEVQDNLGICPISVDSTIIYIKDIKADFPLPERVCDNVKYRMDGSNSIDVDIDCYKGFIWDLPQMRPTETSSDTITTYFPKGENRVTLIVEDINGCTDTLTKTTMSYGIDPDFELDKSRFCVPAEIVTTNTTTSDTTIVKWEWNNEDTSKNTIFEIPETYNADNYLFVLTMEDAIGCVDTNIVSLPVYKPESHIILDPGPNLCVGAELKFIATDFTSEGSHLSYLWEFTGVGSFSQKQNSVTMDKRGVYPLSLDYKEISSGCSGIIDTTVYVVNNPIANFTSDVDDLDIICHPKIIKFSDNSIFDSLGIVTWSIPDSPLDDPHYQEQSVSLDKGTHEITLIAKSLFGCADTIRKSYTLIGPEAEAHVSDNSICIGEEITFTMTNPIDVDSYQWDFGDGTQSTDNPVTHKYNDALDTTVAKLIVKSAENGCDFSIDIPFEVNEVIANFEQIDSVTYCEGYGFIKNTSQNANKYQWQTPEGEINEESIPILLKYPSAGEYTISLIATNTNNGCSGSITKTISLDEVPDFFIIPNLFTPNNDGENDFFKPVILDPNFDDAISIKEFKIYNRFGNLVYNNQNPNDGWNGDFNGSYAPAAVYGYHIILEIIGCPDKSKQGNITIMR